MRSFEPYYLKKLLKYSPHRLLQIGRLKSVRVGVTPLAIVANKKRCVLALAEIFAIGQLAKPFISHFCYFFLDCCKSY